MADRWDVPEGLKKKMVEVARQFRKKPTRGEAVLWRALRGSQLQGTKFRRQKPFGPFVVDFFVAELRLVIGVDGPIHATQQQADRERQELLETLGLRFLRLRTEDVEADLPGVLLKIRDTFEALSP